MIQKRYIKKVIVTDENASAEARGERLRKIRNLANLSRKELCNADIKLNTYKGWELARFGGLPVDGAERVIKRIAEERVICSLDWLLYGRGREPYILPPQNTELTGFEDIELILKEISVFQSLYPNVTYLQIADDALAPYYNEGDYVAGIKYFGSAIATITNSPCIIELTNGEMLVRYLRAGHHPNHFLLLPMNINSTQLNAQFTECELNFAAKIIRHYKTVE